MNPDNELIEAPQQGDLALARKALRSGAHVDATCRNLTALR
jgi:hypothetical protein